VQSAHLDEGLRIREGAYLPHWTRGGGIYAVTFRLADSLPAHVLEAWKLNRDSIVQMAKEEGRPLTRMEDEEVDRQSCFARSLRQVS